MTLPSVYIGGIGLICSLGGNPEAVEHALRRNRSGIRPLNLFDLLHGEPLPVGQVDALTEISALPRTHRLAQIAADQALKGIGEPPEAIILGTTTGGILTTEQLLREKEQEILAYRYHGLHSVSDYLAGEFGCSGPALTVSTACSSGVVALAMGLAMLRRGRVRTVLVGGVDSLSRLTYFGFHSLQLVDRNGCKPLDLNRQGMAVAEGAGMLLLTTDPAAATHGELLGAGLSCDAYHPAAPHPEGEGAFMAMQRALRDSGLNLEDVSYVNLHGTGTPDNDLAESKAVNKLYPDGHPPLSSIKGATGHSLAAAGAIEAVVAAICVSADLLPANTGLQTLDTELDVEPVRQPETDSVDVVLANSFGFGGNNGSLVLGKPRTKNSNTSRQLRRGFGIHGYCCLSGAGKTAETMGGLTSGGAVAGRAELEKISEGLPSRLVRRLKRLPRMTLALATGACENAGLDGSKIDSVYMGTGWGALSETHDFLERLNDSEEQFPSPTDFVGSVHNAPASQVAMMFSATGDNITTSGGDYSFEQALLSAELMFEGDEVSESQALLIGADEGHDRFSRIFDQSVATQKELADGGAAFCLNRETKGARCRITIPFYQRSTTVKVIDMLVKTLVDRQQGEPKIVAVLAGLPGALREQAEGQLKKFHQLSSLAAPVIDYRKFTGEFASASALATALAVSFVETGSVPGILTDGADIVVERHKHSILILGLGQYITAMELTA
ncbi:MAG: beta-ketoacyl synthase N-terminal-like domain-containing protein [Desulfocapsaceae bacterium]|nr:beta-ketoacyl synthase N-terminal-like domain-containing protein [Desulfocapsaceae bacterium]